MKEEYLGQGRRHWTGGAWWWDVDDYEGGMQLVTGRNRRWSKTEASVIRLRDRWRV